ncbi:carbon-nitrogen hydrolase family protein [Streptomyces roseolus]|uniref:carbon-nitrogen hydrolase family protein n=1 Tax=Streptomyces roseolus TaxID=67358 RepID=UPI0016752684|nr:carbon-nitrogen hydrolase family protein [Streptomyces roseolus]
MKIAAAQFAPVAGDVEANVRTIAGLVREAGAAGARLVVFAELSLTGYETALIREDPALTLTEDDPRLEPVREACRAAGTAAVVNGPVRGGGPLPGLTTLVIAPDGTTLARYDKRNLFHGPEQAAFTAGTADGRFVLDGLRFALATCYDNRFPDLAGRAAADDCSVYLASSMLEGGNDSFETVYPVRARDFGLFVALGNSLGPSEVGKGGGRAGIWGPDGGRLADAGPEKPGFVVAEVG